MKKTIVVLLLAGWTGVQALAQVTIEECYRSARENYPLIKQYGLIEKSEAYSLDNAGKGYLPQLTFSGEASYRSDVTKIPIDLSRLGIEGVDIPTLSKDQYGVKLGVTQTLWDGGEIRSQKVGIRTAADVERKETDVTLYAVNERINNLYFGVLLSEARLQLNLLLQDDLARTCEEVRSYVRNGVANQSDLDAVQVDFLRARQEEVGLRAMKEAYVSMLAILTGLPLDTATVFVKPPLSRPDTRSVNRPELGWFDAKIQNYNAEYRKVGAGILPKFGIYATGGYGKPGLDMFDDKFAFYYVAGVQVSWNIGNFYTRKGRRRLIENSIASVETQRETFLFNTGLDIVQKDRDIEKYLEQLRYDDEIIRLKESVRQASMAKMANGVLSGTDLMRDVDAVQQVKEEKILHEMQLLLAVYDLKFATNN